MGTRLVEQVENCVKDPVEGPELWNSFCTRLENATMKHQNETTEQDYECDEYFTMNEVNFTRGIQGISSGVFSRNLWNQYHDAGDVVSSSTKEEEYNLGGKSPRSYVIVDIWTSFTLIIGIFFPSVTGWRHPRTVAVTLTPFCLQASWRDLTDPETWRTLRNPFQSELFVQSPPLGQFTWPLFCSLLQWWTPYCSETSNYQYLHPDRAFILPSF